MRSQLLKSLAVALFTCTAISASYAAQGDDISENIDVSQQSVTQEELAAIQVLAEICPKMISKADKSAFDAGYSRLVHDYLPNEAQPEAALTKLSKQNSFKPFLKEARNDAKQAGNQKNLAVCNDVKAYNS